MYLTTGPRRAVPPPRRIFDEPPLRGDRRFGYIHDDQLLSVILTTERPVEPGRASWRSGYGTQQAAPLRANTVSLGRMNGCARI